jgi:hypothetical protein
VNGPSSKTTDAEVSSPLFAMSTVLLLSNCLGLRSSAAWLLLLSWISESERGNVDVEEIETFSQLELSTSLTFKSPSFSDMLSALHLVDEVALRAVFEFNPSRTVGSVGLVTPTCKEATLLSDNARLGIFSTEDLRE